MKSRIIIVFMGILSLWSLLLLRAAYLQVWPNEKLQRLQKKQFEKVVEVQSRRGAIYDRNGKEFAVSITSFSLFADPAMIKKPSALARKLSPLIGLSYKETLERLSRDGHFVWLKRQMSDQQYAVIQAWKNPGLGFFEEPKRIYPNDSLLAQTIGFVGREGNGLEGLELKYEDLLQGAKRKVSIQRDARGRMLLGDGMLVQIPEAPEIHLTIDSEIQYVLEEELVNAVSENQADSAVGVVLDSQTSEVIAIASAPSYNPNQPQNSSVSARKLRPVTDMFEPGSTMKTFVIAGALREKLIQPNTKFDCENGKMKVGNRIVREADSHHAFKTLTVSEILAKSSNIGATKIAFTLGANRFRQALSDFGFGTVSGVDFPGEVNGMLHDLPWRPHLLSNISFGHGISATALQVANAYAAIANGGTLHVPYIVKAITNPQTGTEVLTETKEVRRVLNPQDASQMRLMLMGVTSPEGTGENAKVPGFPVAGKTGTAQVAGAHGAGYIKGAYVSSFAGFIPANDPKYVIYIAVSYPRKAYYGSHVAAPVFSKVAAFAVHKTGISPALISAKNVVVEEKHNDFSKLNVKAKREVAREIKSQTVPNFTHLSLREVLRRINGLDINVNVQGNGVVVRSIPNPGEALPDTKNMTLILE